MNVSGGPGAAGLGILFETSNNLAEWESLPFLVFGDAAGDLSLQLKAPLGGPSLFVRARVP